MNLNRVFAALWFALATFHLVTGHPVSHFTAVLALFLLAIHAVLEDIHEALIRDQKRVIERLLGRTPTA